MDAYMYGRMIGRLKFAEAQKVAFWPLLLAGARAMIPSMVGGAVLGGGLGGLTADKGDAVGGALRGAGAGALSGAVGKGLSMGMRGISGGGGLLATPPVQSWMNAPGQSAMGRAGRWAINKGSGEFGMSMASSPFMPTGQKDQNQKQQPVPQQRTQQFPMTNLPPGSY